MVGGINHFKVKKICIRCGEEKPITEYYQHKGMADGHLNVCKECVKARIRKYWADGRGRECDKRRQQTESRKAWQREHSALQRKKWKKKRSCRTRFWTKFKKGEIEKSPCKVCGANKLVEAHHSDYNKPFEVVWLCSRHHKEWHRNNTALNQK